MRKRAGALHIRDNKLLLISEGGQGFFWTPGGGLEKNESFVDALARELQEELSATLKSVESFLKFYDRVEDEEVEYFLVDINLPQELSMGTKIHWYSKTDFDSNAMPTSKRIYTVVYPKLLAMGVLQKDIFHIGDEDIERSTRAVLSEAGYGLY